MATISRFSAVAQVGKVEFGGFLAWLAWLGLHLIYLVGFKNRFTTVIAWFITFLGDGRSQMAITTQMMYARVVTNWMESQTQDAIAAAQERNPADQQAEQSEGKQQETRVVA